MNDFKEFSLDNFNDNNDILNENNDNNDNLILQFDIDKTSTAERNNENNNKIIIEYDNDTMEKYRVLRKRKMDPVLHIELEEKYSFQFKYKWDPYTGERLEEDPHGPLYFDPDTLIKHFYVKRLDKLWVNPKDEQAGYFEGYYDDGVGAGEDFYIKGRGYHPEWYIFRLPIIDCYLTKNHNKQHITFGPKLTDNEIIEIEQLANLRPDNYKKMFGYNRPSLIQIKKLYDTAISQTPNLSNIINMENINDIPQERLTELYYKINRDAVTALSNIKG